MYTLTHHCKLMCVPVSNCLFMCSVVCRGKHEEAGKHEQCRIWFVKLDGVGDVWRCYDDGHVPDAATGRWGDRAVGEKMSDYAVARIARLAVEPLG